MPAATLHRETKMEFEARRLRPPASLEHMLAMIYAAYHAMAPLNVGDA